MSESRHDITDLLSDWAMEPGRINARTITGNDGRQKLQVRIDLGVLQMEIDSRPDGQQPGGFPTLLEMQQNRRVRYHEQSQTSSGFVLSSDECRDLRQEAIHFYHRYVALFSIGDYQRVIRDTEHSLRIFDLCRDCGESESDRAVLEQFRPQVIAMRTRAQAELAIRAERPRDALAALDAGIGELREVFEEHGAGKDFEQSNEAKLLQGMRDALVPKLPASQRAELEERLQAAIDAENYELAAILRDELRMLR